MTGSPRDPHPNKEENSHQRLCDFCEKSTAILYCRADSAKLCFACDREVHSTNQLFTKHTRSQLCDSCDDSPASILCSTDALVLCQNCDWERHNRSVTSSSIHDRRPLEGFTGSPSVVDLFSFVGLEDVGKKDLFLNDEIGHDSLRGSDPFWFSDLFVWETPSVVNIDDLIGSRGSSHDFQAMGVPPLPKNRNAACGRHKEEILRQLCELAKSQPDFNDIHGDAEPHIGFEPVVPDQSLPMRNITAGSKLDADPFVVPAYEVRYQGCSDGKETTNQVLPSTMLGGFIDESCLVPDKDSDICGSARNVNDGYEGQSQHPTLPIFPKGSSHELNSQGRDTALSRYKEKKKTRRYDKHIRYESRKARAESRTRIKGRFAKLVH